MIQWTAFLALFIALAPLSPAEAGTPSEACGAGGAAACAAILIGIHPAEPNLARQPDRLVRRAAGIGPHRPAALERRSGAAFGRDAAVTEVQGCRVFRLFGTPAEALRPEPGRAAPRCGR